MITSLKHMFKTFLFMGYSRRISSYSKRIIVSNSTHMMSMADFIIISVALTLSPSCPRHIIQASSPRCPGCPHLVALKPLFNALPRALPTLAPCHACAARRIHMQPQLHPRAVLPHPSIVVPHSCSPPRSHPCPARTASCQDHVHAQPGPRPRPTWTVPLRVLPIAPTCPFQIALTWPCLVEALPARLARPPFS